MSKMDQVKRKLKSSEEKTKKLRNEINQSITSIENLSNDLFYEIFDYLDGIDIFQAFSNLNYRFQELLNSSSILFKIKFHDSISEEILGGYKLD
ncbi:unnamed protein product [Rotaria sp. Silwood2]|nr:unnamed protein product [Rotaria sp. Silwood2]CAF4508864.1 unnamed protein product [Rotaria sp. Silwood2]